MRITETKNYTTKHEKVTEEEVMAANDNGQWAWEMKEYHDKDGNNTVKLYHLDKGCYFDFLGKGHMARKALKECWDVNYMLNNIGSHAVFDDEVEAIDFTMKIINLIKA